MKLVRHAEANGAGPHLIEMRISFGPAFANKTLTNMEFIEKLRSEASKHPNSFLSPMMIHFAHHVQEGITAKLFSSDDLADLAPNTTYYGHGSCSSCDSGSCCLCTYGGNSWCEDC
jgi:hypothetical protein